MNSWLPEPFRRIPEVVLWLILILAAVCTLLLVGLPLLLWRRRRRRRRRRAKRAVQVRYPVVLAHGLLGFDQLPLLGRRASYFRAVGPQLERLGLVVYRPQVPVLATVETRAAALGAFLQDLPHRRVNIVAHSMGGLDARYAITRLGLADRVASLTTIGTPHLGTPLADYSVEMVACLLSLGRPLTGEHDDRPWAITSLTTWALEQFNNDVPDHRAVAYGSVVAALAPKARPGNPLIRLGHAFLAKRCGANDGLVPATSQSWGEILAEVEADHWAQIGWSTGFDARGLFEELLEELRGRGL